MSVEEIAVSDAIVFAIGLAIELPSGAVADLLGRKRIVLAGYAMFSAGYFAQVFANSFLSFTLAASLFIIGVSLQSGAIDALAYDHLTQQNKAKEWSRIISASTSVTQVVYLLSTISGGLLFTAWNRLPYLATCFAGLIGFVAILNFREVRPNVGSNTTDNADPQRLQAASKASFSFSPGEFVRQVMQGTATALGVNVRKGVIAGLAITGAAQIYSWGLLRPLTGIHFGFDKSSLYIIQALAAAAGIVCTMQTTRLHQRFGSESLLRIYAALVGLLLILFATNGGVFIGGFLMVAFSIVTWMGSQMLSIHINERIDNSFRATALSSVALLARLPIVTTQLLLGTMASRGQVPRFSVGLGVMVLIVGVLAASFVGRQKMNVGHTASRIERSQTGTE